MHPDNLLIIADSYHDADMLYAVGVFVPDPFIYLRLAGKCHIVVSDLEIDRAKKQAPHCRVLSLSRYVKLLRNKNGTNPTLPRSPRRFSASAASVRFLCRPVSRSVTRVNCAIAASKRR